MNNTQKLINVALYPMRALPNANKKCRDGWSNWRMWIKHRKLIDKSAENVNAYSFGVIAFH